jgi:hypothetical protein
MMAMMRDPKAMDPRWYTKVFFMATTTGRVDMLEVSPPAQ